MNYCKKSPCENCPYRKDAPLKLWHKEEFAKLLETEAEQFAPIYYCHKKDGHICVGYLMMQDKNYFPNINLRLSLSKNNVTRDYLDKLLCKLPLYKTTKEMIRANFPELLKKRNV